MNIKYLWFHKNHVVYCPNINCRCSILRIENKTSRVDKDGNNRVVYQCLSCFRRFTCCAKRTNIGAIPKKKGEIVREIKSLRRRLRELQNMVYTDNEPLCVLPEMEEDVQA